MEFSFPLKNLLLKNLSICLGDCMLGVSVVIPRSQDKCVRFSGAGVRGLCKPSVIDARN